MAIRDFCKTSRRGEHAKLNDHSVTMKEFGQHDNNGMDSMQWHNRVKDWYNAERRFIFSAPDRKLYNKWVKHIEQGAKKNITLQNSEKNKMIGFGSQFSDVVNSLTKRTDTRINQTARVPDVNRSPIQ